MCGYNVCGCYIDGKYTIGKENQVSLGMSILDVLQITGATFGVIIKGTEQADHEYVYRLMEDPFQFKDRVLYRVDRKNIFNDKVIKEIYIIYKNKGIEYLFKKRLRFNQPDNHCT